ncbi:MAG: VWA domain-containing protein [Chitinivibrionales bacterium]|nr:VWA domain-containing protein [Chitinivibrionales bacterium]
MKYIHNYISALVLIFAVGVPASPGPENDDDKTMSPYFHIPAGDPSIDRLPLKGTRIDVTINGVIAEVTVNQKYANDGNRPINACYVFPASTRAAVHGMKMKIGEQVITAKIKEREQAKETFEKAKQEGKSASLLQQQRPNVFTMDVANIMPGDLIEVELKYTELIVPVDGAYEFIYPTVVGPRYSELTESNGGSDNKWLKNPYFKKGEEKEATWDITVHVISPIELKELVCYSHKTYTEWENAQSAKITLSHDEKQLADRDYILQYRLAGNRIQSGVMLYEGNDEKFFLCMVEPPERIRNSLIPPREYIFVVDISGSMSGFPLQTTKKLLRDLISHLRPTDKFNIILFAGSSSLLSPTSLPVTQENVNKAIAHIDNQRGGGGTRLLPAIKRALQLPHHDTISRNIVVVTDGYIAVEKDVFECIADNLNRANVFSFGIGSSVNRHLIEGIAKAGKGEPFVVTDPSRAPAQAIRFRNYIQSPLLTHIEFETKGFKVYDMIPRSVPDLLAERPLVIFGKWRGKKQGSIRITGYTGEGPFEKTFTLNNVESKAKNSPLQYLWARKRIEERSDFNFGPTDTEERDEIISLGLRYNLLTRYTSFVAVHEDVRNTEGDAKNVKQPLPLPKGVSNAAIGGVRAVPEPGLLLVFFILMFGIGFANLLRKSLGTKNSAE